MSICQSSRNLTRQRIEQQLQLLTTERRQISPTNVEIGALMFGQK